MSSEYLPPSRLPTVTGEEIVEVVVSQGFRERETTLGGEVWTGSLSVTNPRTKGSTGPRVIISRERTRRRLLSRRITGGL